MNDPAVFMLLFILGISAGMVYFGGLCLTVVFAAKQGRSIAVAASFMLRAAFAGAAFLSAAAGGWLHFAVMGSGFLLARWAVMGRFGPEENDTEGP